MSKPTKDPNDSRVATGNLSTGERPAAAVRRAPATPAAGAAPLRATRPATSARFPRDQRITPERRAGPGPTAGRTAWEHRDIDTTRWSGPSTRPRWNGALAVTEDGIGSVRGSSASTRRMYRRRRRAVLLAVLLVVGLVVTISRCAGGSDEPEPRGVAPAGRAAATATTATATEEATTATEVAPTPTAAADDAADRAPATDRVRAPAPSGFGLAGGTGPVLGTAGPVRRFKVAVEAGAGESSTDFANAVDRTLGDPRSWIAGGAFRLQRVPPGSAAEFTVYLASAATSQRMCADGGLSTDGYTSCRLPGRVVINLDRWLHAVPEYDAPLATYQAYAINHEVGHQLGHGHEACPAAGRPAPVMQQQTYGLKGCLPNAWPYIDGKRYAGTPTA